MKQKTIVRYGEPSKWDQEPYGTICEVQSSLGKRERYMQMSKDETLPRWELVDDSLGTD